MRYKHPCNTHTCTQRCAHPPLQGFNEVSHLSLSSLKLKAQAGFRAQDWQMCPVSQFVCVEVEEGFILCEGFMLRVFAHREYLGSVGGSFELSVLLLSTFRAPPENY